MDNIRGNDTEDVGYLAKANDTKNNSLSTLINDDTNEEFACHMWYPKERKLIRVDTLQIYRQNAKFLKVVYRRPKTVKEQGNDEALLPD